MKVKSVLDKWPIYPTRGSWVSPVEIAMNSSDYKTLEAVYS